MTNDVGRRVRRARDADTAPSAFAADEAQTGAVFAANHDWGVGDVRTYNGATHETYCGLVPAVRTALELALG